MHNASINELVSNFAAYTDAEEIYATSKTPATLHICLATAISAVSGGSVATTVRDC